MAGPYTALTLRGNPFPDLLRRFNDTIIASEFPDEPGLRLYRLQFAPRGLLAVECLRHLIMLTSGLPSALCSPHSSLPDHVEDTSRWEEYLCEEEGAEDQELRMNVILLFAADDAEHKDILGGIVLEYYPASNCGLLSYIAVSPMHKGSHDVLSQQHGDSLDRVDVRDSYTHGETCLAPNITLPSSRRADILTITQQARGLARCFPRSHLTI